LKQIDFALDDFAPPVAIPQNYGTIHVVLPQEIDDRLSTEPAINEDYRIEVTERFRPDRHPRFAVHPPPWGVRVKTRIRRPPARDPAFAGMTSLELEACPANVIPAEARIYEFSHRLPRGEGYFPSGENASRMPPAMPALIV